MDFKYNRFNKDGSQIPTAYAKSAVSVEGSLKDLQDAEASVGPDSPSLIAHLLTLGYSYDGAGRYADGEAVSKRALKIYDKNNESDSVLLCNIYCLLGHIQANKKELAEAEKSFKLALEATEDRMNPTVSAARAQAVNEYSTLLYRLKRSSDARELK